MPLKITYCSDCDNVVHHTRKLQQYQWLCCKHKRVEGGSFVDPGWLNDPPYLKCSAVNGGACPLFTPRPEQEGTENG